MHYHFLGNFTHSINNNTLMVYNIFSNFFFWLGVTNFFSIIKKNVVLFYNDHVSKYYIHVEGIEEDIQIKKKILKLIKIKLFFDFILNIHFNGNDEMKSNNIIFHNYFNNFHVLILYGSCFELKHETTLNVQAFKRQIGYYNKYSNTVVNKIIYGKNNYDIMSDTSKYFLKSLFDYIKNHKLFNKNFCVTLTKHDYGTYNEAKFFEYNINKNSMEGALYETVISNDSNIEKYYVESF